MYCTVYAMVCLDRNIRGSPARSAGVQSRASVMSRCDGPGHGHARPMANEYSAAYLAEVRRRASEAESRSSAALADLENARATQAALPIFTADVRDASELSISECREQYVARFRPLVIQSIGKMTDPSPWSLPWLRDHYGQKCAAVNVGGSQMAASCEVSGVDVMTIGELATRIEGRTAASPSVYLYDCSLPLKIPALCERLGVPVYFAHDWLQRTREVDEHTMSPKPNLAISPSPNLPMSPKPNPAMSPKQNLPMSPKPNPAMSPKLNPAMSPKPNLANASTPQRDPVSAGCAHQPSIRPLAWHSCTPSLAPGPPSLWAPPARAPPFISIRCDLSIGCPPSMPCPHLRARPVVSISGRGTSGWPSWRVCLPYTPSHDPDPTHIPNPLALTHIPNLPALTPIPNPIPDPDPYPQPHSPDPYPQP